jgi:hypothetical protein
MGWVTRREMLVGSVVIVCALVFLSGVAVVLWLQVVPAWAAAHGQGTYGQWTATRQGSSGRKRSWFGDFAPDDGGPVRRDVVLSGSTDDVAIGKVIPAIDGGDRRSAFAVTDTTAWVMPGIAAGIYTGIAGAVVWFVGHHLRRPRQKVVPGRS